jgi:hypothetical protein
MFAAMRRTSDDLEDRPDVNDWIDVTELIARISAEHGHPVEDTGRHRLRGVPDPRRSRRRRLAPAIAGVAVVAVASTIALTLRANHEAPDGRTLDAALVASAPAASVAPPAAAPPARQEPAAAPAPSTAPAPAAAAAPSTAAAPGTRSRAATPSSAAKPAPAVDDGVQAARRQGWKLVDRDEFSGAIGAKWTPFAGEGNTGDARRTPDAVGVRNGVAVVRGDADGNTGGMAWSDDRRTGRWEMRAKFPKGDAQYRPELVLRPEDGGSDDDSEDSDNGQVDFAATTSASDSVSFVLHHGSGDRESAEKELDITQWHNYAVEVTADRVTGYVDGQKWFESTDPDTLPRGPVHPVIQLDRFPEGDSPEPTELLVDWMRIYQ